MELEEEESNYVCGHISYLLNIQLTKEKLEFTDYPEATGKLDNFRRYKLIIVL